MHEGAAQILPDLGPRRTPARSDDWPRAQQIQGHLQQDRRAHCRDQPKAPLINSHQGAFRSKSYFLHDKS